jgi:cellulose synthase/poly-beta-1,6-N-acetylglucosamine synthase-like glycosyltransferase
MRMLACSLPTSLSVVIPAFNEQSRLPPTLDSSLRYLAAERGPLWEVIVVDDGSNDGTAAAVRQHGLDDRVRLLRAPCNRGKGAAVVRCTARLVGVRPFIISSCHPMSCGRWRASMQLVASAS